MYLTNFFFLQYVITCPALCPNITGQYNVTVVYKSMMSSILLR